MQEYGSSNVNCARHRNPREKLIGRDNALACIVAFLCTYGTQSAHPVRANKTTLFLFQPSATTAISAPAGNMRINRRKINTRNANTQYMRAHTVDYRNGCARSVFFSM